MASFTNEQIKKAVDLYFQYDRKIEKVRRELGYPERHALRKWIKLFEETGKYFVPNRTRTSPFQKNKSKLP